MSSPPLTFEAVLQVLRLIGDIEWARVAVNPSSDGTVLTPIVAWRYETREPIAEKKLRDAFESFGGAIEWTLQRGDRNWALWPTRLEREFETGNWRTDSELSFAIGDSDPEFAALAVADLRDMLKFLEVKLGSGE